MTDFLMPMWEGGGTVPPQLGVARRLIARGHRVHVLGDPTLEARAREVGCGFTPWREAPHRTTMRAEDDLFRDWEKKSPIASLKNVRDVFMLAPAAGYAADTQRAIEATGPDVLIPDAMLLGALIAGEASGLPMAPLLPSIWMFPAPGAPAIGPGFLPARGPLGRLRDRAMLGLATRLFDGGLPRLNAIRAEHGLSPLAHLFDQVLQSDRVLVLTSPSFDFSSAFVPDHVRYVGPVLDDPQWVEPWSSPFDEHDDRPLVLVGFSSTFQDQVPLLRRVVEALAALPVRAVLTLGEMLDPTDVRGTDNVHVCRSAPHSQLLPEAALVVTHCGHGTSIKALAAGLPAVCIPMGRDQNDNAARIVHLGAGVRLAPSASARKIRAAVRRVLAEPRFRAAAARVATTLADEATRLDPVRELEALVDGHAARRELRA